VAGFTVGFIVDFVIDFIVDFVIDFIVDFVIDFIVDFVGFNVEDLPPFLILEAIILARVQGDTKTPRISI